MVSCSSLSGAEFFSTLGLKRGAVVSLVGAGGKTTLMFTLAEIAVKQGLRVLVTTSTRIFIPDSQQYHHLSLSERPYFSSPHPGIYVAGMVCESPLKMKGLSDEVLNPLLNQFDLVLIEADGSKCKPLKGWSQTEPVISPHTTHTIGVIDLMALSCQVSDTLVHRLPLFLQLTGLQDGERLNFDAVCRIIEGERGLFQYARGRRIVLCNKCESNEAQRWLEGIRKRCHLDIYGASLQKGIYYGRN